MSASERVASTWKQLRSINDCGVHDFISFTPEIWKIIDTPHFQRLRYIKQLGTSYYVWPGASHNRFEHCIGVAYLARKMVRHIQRHQPELHITEREALCVEIAGLCHDLGHGPWSHVWDGLFIPKALPGKKWQHEVASEMMFDDLVAKNDVGLSEDDVALVKALIAGDRSKCSLPENRNFLFEIVANKRNGIDVDKFDYILRDSRAIGDKGSLSLRKLIKSARVIDNEICYDIKDANQLQELCHTRFSLHKRIYNHKTAKAIEYMIVDALISAQPYMKIAEQVEIPERYVRLNDSIMNRVLETEQPELEKARSILQRIEVRDLNRCVDFKSFGWEMRRECEALFTPEKIVKAAQALPLILEVEESLEVETNGDDAEDTDQGLPNLVPGTASELKPEHVIVDFSHMHHGMKDKNPLDFIKFYSKQNPDVCSSAGQGDVTHAIPNQFAELTLRIYTRDVRFFGIIQKGYRALLATMEGFETTDQTPTGAASTPSTTSATLSIAGNIPSTPPPGKKSGLSRTSSGSFSNNVFTTVPPTYIPASPSRVLKRTMSRTSSKRTLFEANENENHVAKRVKNGN